MTKIALRLPTKILNLFEPMRNKLIASEIKINFETYIGYLSVISIILGTFAIIFSAFIFKFTSTFSIQTLISYSILVGLSIIITVNLIGFVIPYILADNRSRVIEATLPSLANYMSILATTGMTTGNIINSLGRVCSEFNIKAEMDLIRTDIEVLGYDVHRALRHAYEVSSCRGFANLLFGVVSVSQMGGDLASYLKNQAEKNTNKRLLLMRGFIDNLAIIAEIYITIIIVGPLMLIVMLTVMSFIGGGAMLGSLSVSQVMHILTFIFIPIGIIILILAVEATSPMR
jgi:flagellar protein FlaJ